MRRDPRSTSRIRRLTPRQRKKLRVGEFQEHCFDVELVFHAPMRGEPYHDFINDFFGFLEQRGLLGGGFGGKEPFSETEGVIARIERGSPNEEDREAVVQWLRARQEVVDARAKDFKDAWHGYGF
ncbi:50S ribosome-binding protein YggL [Massilia sp. YIM B02763]|uniref:50S ribosome-binding protein YggL n=1 Tax=Massilia sp. YIM B02763 TaxID=3050130 RepID=UPI0025B6E4FB|nr:50S ribosome-binding protein YggL [Massilia sp. YIM B02763]MDN4054191.1 50S ribosome-binding protein YggL [Massilia sp. YIM B02763]